MSLLAVNLSTPTIVTASAPYHQEARAVYADKPFAEWTDSDHKKSWKLLHTIAAQSQQYIVVGQQRKGENAFEWQVVPYSSSDTASFKQLTVFWNFLSRPQLEAPKETHLEQVKLPEQGTSAGIGDDIFCNQAQIEKQKVFGGREVVVLLNHAPHIAPRDSQPLDFLILPKEHRENFNDLRPSEYLETMQLAAKLFAHFSSSVTASSLYHKTGALAGQMVNHWHLHVTLSTNLPEGPIEKVQSIFSGLWRTKLSENVLASKVSVLKAELGELDK